MKKIAVIGGGPKAAALCAKAHCLNRGSRKIEVRVFEKEEWAAAWSGRHGYTDGQQRLCTPVERDVGFPYDRGLLDADGVRELFRTFSWNAFLIEAAGAPDNYRGWVDRGRKPPTHRVYAQYIAWVIQRARARRTIAEVTGLNYVGGAWTVKCRNKKGVETEYEGFDGVVVTGPGPALNGFMRPDDPRISDGVAFWRDPAGFLARAEQREEPIIVAGSGGTSAAIAAWLTRRTNSRPIIIVGNQAALFTRTESFFENALFSDEEAWAALDSKIRLNVAQRLNRGVVWAAVSDALSTSVDVRFQPGRVESATIQPGIDGIPEELRIDRKDATGIHTDPASLIVDAAGFDPWWFVDLLPEPLRAVTLANEEKEIASVRKDLEAAIRDDLSLDLGAPGLHTPMLSMAQGPGFGSLMVLGAMSERILKSYL